MPASNSARSVDARGYRRALTIFASSSAPAAAGVGVIGQGTWQLERASQREAVATLRRGARPGAESPRHRGDVRAGRRRAAARRGDHWPARRSVRRLEGAATERESPRNGPGLRSNAARPCRTDHLDCYLLHWRGSIPLAETVQAFVDLSTAGKIRAWGVSNFDDEDLAELEALGLGLPVCNQVLYHLRERAIEHTVLPWCHARGVAVTAYTPFGPGAFPDAQPRRPHARPRRSADRKRRRVRSLSRSSRATRRCPRSRGLRASRTWRRTPARARSRCPPSRWMSSRRRSRRSRGAGRLPMI